MPCKGGKRIAFYFIFNEHDVDDLDDVDEDYTRGSNLTKFNINNNQL